MGNAVSLAARPNVHYQRVDAEATDLCHRATAFDTFRRLGTLASHFLFLNDGVRGPFVASTVQPSVPYPGRGPAAAAASWLHPFDQAFRTDRRVRAVGPSASCEEDLHLQSWAVAIDARVQHVFERRYRATCGKVAKRDAILGAEVGSITEMLESADGGSGGGNGGRRQGAAMASFHPALKGVDGLQARRFRKGEE